MLLGQVTSQYELVRGEHKGLLMVLITIVTLRRHQTPGTATLLTSAEAEQVKWVQLAQYVFAT